MFRPGSKCSPKACYKSPSRNSLKLWSNSIRITITIPLWLVRILILPVLLYRRVRYGYSFYRMPLSQGQYAVVDADDYSHLSRHKWYAVKGGRHTFYAVRGIIGEDGRRRRFTMHREVLKVPDNMLVDHVNRNGLDNRKANLRPATHTQNMCNRGTYARKRDSKYKGVYWDKGMKKWRVRIGVNGTRLYIGKFSDEIEAARAYDRAARKYHKEFAALNFPDD